MTGQQALGGDVEAQIEQYKSTMQVMVRLNYGPEIEWKETQNDDFVEVHVREKGMEFFAADDRLLVRAIRGRLENRTRDAVRLRLYRALALDMLLWVGERVKVQRPDGVIERNESRLIRRWLERKPLRQILASAIHASMWRRGILKSRASVVSAHRYP